MPPFGEREVASRFQEIDKRVYLTIKEQGVEPVIEHLLTEIEWRSPPFCRWYLNRRRLSLRMLAAIRSFNEIQSPSVEISRRRPCSFQRKSYPSCVRLAPKVSALRFGKTSELRLDKRGISQWVQCPHLGRLDNVNLGFHTKHSVQ